MKIALVNFPILDVGGITTWAEACVHGFRLLGYECDHFYSSDSKKFNCNEEEPVIIGGGGKYHRGRKVASRYLSYRESEIDKTLKVLNEYDIIYFIHPSPHPTKYQMNSDSCLNWIKLYSGLEPSKKVITTFHDRYWERNNSWFALVAKYVNLVIVGQKPNLDSASTWPGPSIWVHQPMIINEEDAVWKYKFQQRMKNGIIAHQWIKWKNHHLLFEALKDSTVPLNVFAGGKAYHDLHKEGVIAKFFSRNEVEDENYDTNTTGHVYHGYVHREVLVDYYKKSLFSIDGSTRGYNNYTHIEPMLYGCLSLVHEDVMSNESCQIPREACILYNWENLREVVDDVVKIDMKGVAKRAFDYVMENHRAEYVCSLIIEAIPESKICDEEKYKIQVAKAMDDHAYYCWGTYDKSEEKYCETYCNSCSWKQYCEEYVINNGKRDIEKEQFSPEQEQIAEEGKENESAVLNKDVVEVEATDKVVTVQENHLESQKHVASTVEMDGKNITINLTINLHFGAC